MGPTASFRPGARVRADNNANPFDLAAKLLFGNSICPAVFVISNKSLNRNKNDQEAGT
jgi:hypothetical protein